MRTKWDENQDLFTRPKSKAETFQSRRVTLFFPFVKRTYRSNINRTNEIAILTSFYPSDILLMVSIVLLASIRIPVDLSATEHALSNQIEISVA